MISLEEHRDAVLATVHPLGGEPITVTEALGRVLAAPPRATLDLPGFTNSAMDGYAVRAADLAGAAAGSPVSLPVADDVPAGDGRTLTLPPGEAVRIMTGAPMPEGADAVVPVEESDGGTDVVALRLAPAAGRHVRTRGEDVRAGDTLLEAGTSLSPGHLALLAAAGCSTVEVFRRPRVAVLSTGDELVPVGQVPGPGQLVDSNSAMLAALVRAAGGEVIAAGSVVDDAAALDHAFADATAEGRADLVLTTGGVSMGAYDVVKEVLTRASQGAGGTAVEFVKVAMRPGMPQGRGVLGDRRVPLLTLPGNPVSALVSFHVFALPAIRMLSGRSPEAPLLQATVGEAWRSVPGKVELTRVVVTEGVAHPSGGQGSHMLGALASATHLALVPAEVTEVSAGDRLRCLPLLGVTA